MRLKGRGKVEKYKGNIYAEIIEVSGFYGAIHGARNPMNSWRLMDSIFVNGTLTELGDNDKRLLQNLIKGGGEHRKFLRMIHVQVDLNLPRYIWSEFDTYKFNVKNSTSTMHKLLNSDDEKKWKETELDKLLNTRGKLTTNNFFYSLDDEKILVEIIDKLNEIRDLFLASSDSKEKRQLKRRAKQLLPESFLQMRTVDTNYEELRNIFLQRKNHTLDIEWGVITEMIKNLPFAKELLLYGIED
jgi:hypothetical protein